MIFKMDVLFPIQLTGVFMAAPPFAEQLGEKKKTDIISFVI